MRRLTTRKIDSVDVFRTWLWPLAQSQSPRAHAQLRFVLRFGRIARHDASRPDVIIASSPQLLVGLSGWWLAFSRQIPFVFEVRDLWPESLDCGGSGQRRLIAAPHLGGDCRISLRAIRSDRGRNPAFKEHLIGRWRVPPEKIAVVENGVETDLFRPLPEPSVTHCGAEPRCPGQIPASATSVPLEWRTGWKRCSMPLQTAAENPRGYVSPDRRGRRERADQGTRAIPQASKREVPRSAAARKNSGIHLRF